MAVNFHDGPLPKYAGLYSSSWALIKNEKQHGCCWHKIENKIDAGEILESIKFKINRIKPISPTLVAKGIKTIISWINTYNKKTKHKSNFLFYTNTLKTIYNYILH